jgi:uncharacterized protein (DUF1684 family)
MRAPAVMRPLLGLGLCCVCHAADRTPQPAPQKVEVTNTEHPAFPAGGTLHLKNSVGELTIEAWDQAGMEITTIKSSKVAVEGRQRDKASKLLEKVKITTERKGQEVIVSTAFPKHSKMTRLVEGMTDFDMEYRIKVPRAARLVVDHTMGEVHIEDIRGEIHATDDMGLITVQLPDGQYSIDALSKLGAVDSDFTGNEKTRKWLGHTFLENSPAAAQKLFLRIGYGDIVIARLHQPPPPAPGVLSGK